MFRKGKKLLRIELCTPLVYLDKFQVRSKIISAKLCFMNLYETELPYILESNPH
jgi:hypothetical protein